MAFPRRSESIKLRGNSTGHAPPRRSTPPWRSTWRSAAFRIRQAKGELHRTRLHGVPRGVPRRSESVKLKGNSTGRTPPWRSTWRSAAFRIRQAQQGDPRGVPRLSESVKLRGNSAGYASPGTGPAVVRGAAVSVVVVSRGGRRGGGPVAPRGGPIIGRPAIPRRRSMVVIRGGGPWWWSQVVVCGGGPVAVAVVPWCGPVEVMALGSRAFC